MIDDLNNFPLSSNFNLEEFQCPCCHVVKLWTPLLIRLQIARDRIGEPIDVVSGYRCAKYNATLPDALPNSAHRYGLAADCRPRSHLLDRLAKIAKDVGINRIKLYPPIKGKRLGWVHLGFNDYKI